MTGGRAGQVVVLSLLVGTTAHRPGLTLTCAPLDRPSFQVDGRDNRGEAPDAPVLQSTRGNGRDQQPDRHQGRLDLMGEYHAGLAMLMKPLRGHPRDTHNFGQVVTEHVRRLPSTKGTTFLMADSALDRAEKLPKPADAGTAWMTRVPAAVPAAQHPLEQVPPKRCSR